MPKNIFNSLKRYVDRAKSNARSAVMRDSYVDTRSDTTRKGYHEGRTRYGYNYGANENGITGTIARVIDGKDYNPYLQTGIAPMPDKIASYKDISRIYKTVKNLSKITPKQWTALQDAAIARGDMAEAQRLRDLHFKASAHNTKIDIPLWTSSEEHFNSFDLRHFGKTDNGFFGYGHYLTPLERYAASYHPVNRKFYVNIENPYIGDNDAYFNRINYVKDRLARRKEGVLRDLNKGRVQGIGKRLGITENTSLEDAERILDKYVSDETIKWNNKYVKYTDEFEGKDGVLSWREMQGVPNKREGVYREVVVPKGEQIKSADAVTYDDNGVRIPLGDRDNFNVNDIRWSWLLPVFGVGAATAVSSKDKNKSKFRLGGIYSLY